MGFIKNQQIKIAANLLEWKLKNDGMKVPERKILKAQAEKVVDEAIKITKTRGINILSILKELINKQK
ncbi:MAG: hypothetical protein GY714_24465 [Desulfobacterales bacterium]|nr:hypothetical protein [Desulfobacterales bacterium]